MTVEVAASLVVQVIVAVVSVVLVAIEEMIGAVLSTVTVIEAEVVVLPAASLATASIVWKPSDTDVLFHVVE